MQIYKNAEQNKGAILPVSELPTFYNHGISMDSESPVNSASEKNTQVYIYITVDYFSKYFVAVKKPHK